MSRNGLRCVAIGLIAAGAAWSSQLQDLTALVTKGKTGLAKGACKDAETNFKAALDIANNRAGSTPSDIDGMKLYLAESMLCRGIASNALTIADEVAKRDPADSIQQRARFILAEAQAATGALDEAAGNYSRAAELARGSRSDPELPLTTVLAHAAALDRIRGDYAKAASFLDQAEKLVPGRRTEAQDALLLAVERGDLARVQEDDPAARKYYDVALQAGRATPNHPLMARASIGQAELALSIGDLATAESRAKEARQRINQLTASREYLLSAEILARIAAARNDLAGAADEINDGFVIQEKENVGLSSPDTADSLDELGWLQTLQGNFKSASENLTEAAKIRRSLFPRDHLDIALSALRLGLLYRRREDWSQAEAQIREASRIQKAILGPQSRTVAGTAMQLAEVYLDQKKTQQAEAALRDALAAGEKLRPEDSVLRRADAALGLILQASGRSDEAEPLLSRWLKSAGNPPLYDRQTAQILEAMADMDLSSGRFAEAERGYQQAMDALTKSGAPVAPALHSKSGRALSGQRKWDAAVAELRKALDSMAGATSTPEYADALMQSVGALVEGSHLDEAKQSADRWLRLPSAQGPEWKPEQIRVLSRLAAALADGARQADSAPYWNIVAKAAEARNDIPLQDSTRIRLADAFKASGKSVEAAALYEKAADRSISLRRFPEAEKYLVTAKTLHDLEYASMLQSLSAVYLQDGKFSAAKPLLDQARGFLEANNQKAGPSMANVLDGLGVVAKSEKQPDEAARLYNRAKQSLTELRDPPKEMLGRILFHLGELAEEGNNKTGAEGYFRQSLENLSSEGPTQVRQLEAIASAYNRWGRFDDARKLWETTLDRSRKEFGPESIEAAWGFHGLADFYNGRKQYGDAVRAGGEALKLAKLNTGEESPETRVMLHSLSGIYRNSGNMDAAIESGSNELDLLEKAKTPREQLSPALLELAGYCRDAKQYDRASQYYARLAELWDGEGVSNFYYSQGRLGAVLVTLDRGDVKTAQSGYNKMKKELGSGMERLKLMQAYRNELRRTGHEKEAKQIDSEISAETASPIPR